MTLALTLTLNHNPGRVRYWLDESITSNLSPLAMFQNQHIIPTCVCILQVQVRQWACPLGDLPLSCVCGVALREGDTVFILDMCNDDFRGPYAVTYNPQHLPTTDNGGVTISDTGLSYKARHSWLNSIAVGKLTCVSFTDALTHTLILSILVKKLRKRLIRNRWNLVWICCSES